MYFNIRPKQKDIGTVVREMDLFLRRAESLVVIMLGYNWSYSRKVLDSSVVRNTINYVRGRGVQVLEEEWLKPSSMVVLDPTSDGGPHRAYIVENPGVAFCCKSLPNEAKTGILELCAELQKQQSMRDYDRR
jgi:hypothetical protein